MDSFTVAGSKARWMKNQGSEMKAENSRKRRTNSLHQLCRMARHQEEVEALPVRLCECDCLSKTELETQTHTTHTKCVDWFH